MDRYSRVTDGSYSKHHKVAGYRMPTFKHGTGHEPRRHHKITLKDGTPELSAKDDDKEPTKEEVEVDEEPTKEEVEVDEEPTKDEVDEKPTKVSRVPSKEDFDVSLGDSLKRGFGSRPRPVRARREDPLDDLAFSYSGADGLDSHVGFSGAQFGGRGGY